MNIFQDVQMSGWQSVCACLFVHAYFAQSLSTHTLGCKYQLCGEVESKSLKHLEDLVF